MDEKGETMYEVKRNGAMWEVKNKSSGVVQFKSLRRANCMDWVKNNTPKGAEE